LAAEAQLPQCSPARARRSPLPLSLSGHVAPRVSASFPLSSFFQCPTPSSVFLPRRPAALPLPVAPLCRTPRALAPHPSPEPWPAPEPPFLLEGHRAWIRSTRIQSAGGAEAVARSTRTPRPPHLFLASAVLSRSSSAATTSPVFPRALAPLEFEPPPSTEPRAAAIPPRRRQSPTTGRRHTF
jgi:hypothetical protein